MNQDIGAVVLAAGRGSRMKAPPTQNKVVYQLNHKPMVCYTINTLHQCGIRDLVVVVGYAKDSVMAAVGDSVRYVTQDNPKGTGHAIQVALPQIPELIKHVIVLYGDDSAFYPPELIQTLVTTHLDHQNQLTLISVNKPDPTGLGRIIRDSQGKLQAIIEEKNATPEQKLITEINTGLYCFETGFLKTAADNFHENPVSGEYYLTEAVDFAVTHDYQVEALLWPDGEIWHGVNTPEQLQAAEMRMQQKNAVQ